MVPTGAVWPPSFGNFILKCKECFFLPSLFRGYHWQLVSAIKITIKNLHVPLKIILYTSSGSCYRPLGTRRHLWGRLVGCKVYRFKVVLSTLSRPGSWNHLESEQMATPEWPSLEWANAARMYSPSILEVWLDIRNGHLKLLAHHPGSQVLFLICYNSISKGRWWIKRAE